MEKLFEHQQTLALFLVFFVPGFISLKVYDLFVPTERRDFSKAVLDAVAYSTLNFVALSWLIAFMRSGELAPWLWYIALALVCLGGPTAWPVLLIRFRQLPAVAARIPGPVPRVWDSLFGQRKPYWVIAHLKDGRRIGGVYSTASFASSSPAAPEIFLQEVWELSDEGAFKNRVEGSAGILLLGEELIGLELFHF